MPLWRDPLDELIDDLERTLPAQPRSSDFDNPPRFEEVQYAFYISRQGKEAWARAEKHDPRVQALMAYYDRFRQRQERERPGGDGDKSA